MSEICVRLATSVFQALRPCFTKNQLGGMCRRLHLAMECDHLLRLLDLGLSLDQFIKKTKVGTQRIEGAQFSSIEQSLWVAYTDLCIAIGGGTRQTERRVILGEHRLAIFEKIAGCSCGMPMRKTQTNSKPLWPLWLAVPHRRLVAANVVNETSVFSKADSFLANAFISALSEVFSDPELHLSNKEIKDRTSQFLEEGIPLSLSNARIFGAAVQRLPKTDQISTLSSLLVTVQSGLTVSKSDDSKYALLRHQTEYSEFVARAVSMCCSLVIALTCSKTLGERFVVDLARDLQPSHLPNIQPELPVIQAEKCFVSLLDGSADFLEQDLTSTTMDKVQCETLQSILERAFSLSFSTAVNDRCYLLFASWSHLGKSSLWFQEESRNIVPYEGLPDDLSRLILELRDEMCYVHRLIWQINRGSAGSGLSRLIDQKEPHRTVPRKSLIATVKKELRSMVSF